MYLGMVRLVGYLGFLEGSNYNVSWNGPKPYLLPNPTPFPGRYPDIQGTIGVPLTVYPWYFLCSLITHKYPLYNMLYRAFWGIYNRQ